MLVGHWPLIGNTNDYSGFNNNGTPTSITYTAGKIGQAALMNSGNIIIPTAATSTYTFAFWIKLKSGFNGNFRKFFQQSSNRSPGFWFLHTSNGLHLRQVLSNDANAGNDTSPLTIGAWTHVVFMCFPNGTGGTRIQTYLNGVLNANNNFTGTPVMTGTTLDLLANDYDINDFRLYNNQLSEYEIKELYKAKVTHLSLDGHSLDIAGYLYNGTPQASTSYTNNSKIYSQAFQNTDGGGSKAITIENGTQNITGDQTIAMWLFPTSFAARRNPWNKAYGGEGTITQETNGALNYFWGTHGGNSLPYQGFTSGVLTINTWNHIAIVRDLSGTTPQLRWYINGALSTIATPSYTAATATTNGTTIGAGYTSPYHGRISDVRQYGTALTVTDILALYNKRANFDNLGNVSGYELDEENFSTNYNINDKGQIIALEFDEVTGTQNTNAKQEIKDNGTLFINGEFSEVD
jgi:hypothetical protein